MTPRDILVSAIFLTVVVLGGRYCFGDSFMIRGLVMVAGLNLFVLPNIRVGHELVDSLMYGASFGVMCASAGPHIGRGGFLIGSVAFLAAYMGTMLTHVRQSASPLATITGLVVHGVKKGRDMDWPTANLVQTSGPSLACGFYDCETIYGPGTLLVTTGLEVHVHRFHGDLYGKELILWNVRPAASENEFTTWFRTVCHSV